MSTLIKYKNYYGVEVTSQQSNQLNNYSELTIIDNRLKKEKHFYENELEFIKIFIYPDEDVNSILNSLTELDTEYSIAKDLEEVNGYIIWKHFHYKNGVLNPDYRTDVQDSQGRVIARRSYNGNGTIKEKGFKKYYIGGNVLYDDDGEVDIGYADDDLILFDFSGDNIKIEMVLAYGDDGTYDSVSDFLDVWQTLLPFMTPGKLTYLSNLEPLIPNVDLYS